MINKKILDTLDNVYLDLSGDDLYKSLQGFRDSCTTPINVDEIFAILSKIRSSESYAKNIPGWSTWTEADAQDWYDINIGVPLQTDIPASVTLANIRPILVSMLSIMRMMGTMLWAIGRMAIALRIKNWPDLT